MAGIPGPYDGRFATTAEAYARFRLAYPEALIARVMALTALTPGDAVLDLGCGPGPLALPLARAGLAVTAVDPEPAMLEVLKEAAKQEHLAIAVHTGSSFAMPAGIGPFRMVAMGRAFHWTVRVATAQALDGLIGPSGAVVLFEDVFPATVENRWRKIMDSVAAQFGSEAAPHRAERASTGYRSHESILLDSPFSELETAGVIVHRRLSLEDILGYAASKSVTSRGVLGEGADAFRAALTGALLALAPDGQFSEIAEMRALIARRPVR